MMLTEKGGYYFDLNQTLEFCLVRDFAFFLAKTFFSHSQASGQVMEVAAVCIHSFEMMWRLFIKYRNIVVQTAKAHIRE